MTSKLFGLSAMAGLLFAHAAHGQEVIVYRVETVVPGTVNFQQPIFQTSVPHTVVVQRPIASAPLTFADRPVTVWRPVAPAAGMIVQQPTVVYSPIVSPVPAYMPVVAYSPVIAPTIGTPVYVIPQVFVPGQPIRNFFRAITY